MSVLVIDDNKQAADALVRLLCAVGYTAEAAYAGHEGLGRLENMHADHVIVDIGMPEMDGYDVAKELRVRHGQELHLIALSGYGMEDDKRQARDAGFDEHLTKPVALSDLRAALDSSN
jgi:CheY-like chemotaxis protein